MYFTINDDAIIESVLSGGFSGTPDGHTVYLRYPLSWLLKTLYSILPRIPWYGLYLLLCFVFAFGVMSFLAYRRLGKRYGMLALFVAGAVWMFVPTAVIVHYTIAAAALGAAAILLTAYGGPYWLTTLIMGLCFCTRQDVFFLAVPFWGVVLVWRLITDRDKKLLYLVLAVAGCVGACAGINSLQYRSDAWQEYMDYNETRTAIVDYSGYVSYDKVPEAYEALGIHKDDCVILEKYAYVLKGDLDADFFRRVLQVNEETQPKSDLITGVIGTVKEYRNWIFDFKEPYTWVAIGIYVVLLVLFFRRKAWLKLLLCLALGVGRNLIWIYLFWKGRFPDHVMISLILLEMATLSAMLLEELREKQYEKRWLQVVFAVAAVGILFGAFCSLKTTVNKQRQQDEKRQSFDVVKEYFDEHKEDLFLLDVWSMWDYDRGVFETTDGTLNYFLAGGWYSGSPVMKKRFTDLGVLDGAEAMRNLSNVYYVVTAGTDDSWLESYLGADVQVKVTVGEFDILQVQ